MGSSRIPTDKNSVVTLAIGIVAGFGLAYSFLKISHLPITFQSSVGDRDTDHHVREVYTSPDFHQEQGFAWGHTVPASNHSLIHQDARAREEDIIGAKKPSEVRVLCWVLTGPANHKKKAQHVKNTWGKRCNKLIFMSSKADEKLGAVGLPNVQEGRDWLWAKTKEAFKYVWEHHRDEADWFMKADDDTYVVVENLRFMLREFDPNSPIYFGCRFLKRSLRRDFMTGGPGYVLSKEALRRFVEQALPDADKCKQSHRGPEDIEIAKCLDAVGVTFGDSRDTLGRYRFLHLALERHVRPGHSGEPSWYRRKIYYPQSLGMDGCSDTAISFHYVTPNQMYLMEYLIYHVRPVGVSSAHGKTGSAEGNTTAVGVPWDSTTSVD